MMDDDYEVLFGENLLFDNEVDFTVDNDIAEETTVDQIFDEKLEAELEEANKIASEPPEALLPEDEQTDSSDNDIGERSTSNINQKGLQNPPGGVQVSKLFA
ncbi:unnamed protein product [Adineta steineri]|uniref:Uncharacterized protein n=1 Tax=Adineta steineri TaxID=433720 RepID=A0A816EQM3_9BILA|nr:unnamed protein product [Adineta steineri]CAF1649710.1 unnamed protein product [Adineta steineri]